MKDFNFYMGQFLEYLKYEKNYSLLTINGYKEDLMFLNDYFNKENINFLEVEYQDIRLLYNFLEDKHYSKNTIARHISSIRSFFILITSLLLLLSVFLIDCFFSLSTAIKFFNTTS